LDGFLNRNPPTISARQTYFYKNFVYHDPFGVSHLFGGTLEYDPTGCDSTVNSFTSTATDGSGLTLHATRGGSGPTITQQIVAPNGKTITAPVGSAANGSTITDSNGNQISVSSAGVFTDTTGSTVMTVSGAVPSPVTLTYPTLGGTAAYIVKYAASTVQTDFGCSLVTEYSATGVPLVSEIDLPDTSKYTFTYETTPNNSSAVTGRLASVTLPTGGKISYAYSGGSNGIVCTDGSTAGLTRKIATDQNSAASTWTYSRTPGGATSQTTVTDGLQNQSKYTFVAAGSLAAQYYETSRSVYQLTATGTPVLARNTCYNGAASPCATTALTLPVAQIDAYETLDGIAFHGATVKYNGYGLQTEQDIYDFGGTASSHGTGTLLREEKWNYGGSIINLVTEDDVYDGSNKLAGKTLYAYDGTTPTASSGVPQHIAVSGPRGNLTGITQYASSGATYAYSATYEDTGSILTNSGPNGTTTYTYDSTFTSITNTALPTPSSGVALVVGATTDLNSGVPQTAKDPNKQITSIPSYDAFLRPTAINYPDGGNTVVTYDSYGNLNQVGIAVAQSPGTSTDTQILYDSFGRQGRIAVANGLDWYQRDSCYDANGNQQFASYAYHGSGFSGANENPICSGSGGDTYAYDVLGRLKTVTRGDGETRSYTHKGRATQFVDENSVTRISQVDGLGRRAIVCEISSNNTMPSSGSTVSCGTDITGAGFKTTYSYVPTGTTTVTQGVQTRTFLTDWLGRTTSVTEPESGTTTFSYAYNATGLAVTRKRPKANQSTPTVLTTTTTQYDSLGRVVTITYDDNLTPNKTYVYDANPTGGWAGQNGTNLVGRLAYLGAIVGSNTATHTGQLFSYDPMGRVVGMWECGPSTCGTSNQANRPLSYTYDWAGNMMTSTDGGGVTSTYTVSPANELQSLTSSVGNTMNPAAIISNVQNGPNGPNSFSLGNGLTGVNGYDSLGRYYGAWVCSTSNVPLCTGGTQTYGEAVSLSGQHATAECDTVLGQCMNYGYDEFSRLTSRTVTSGTVQNFAYSYDRFGNRWSQTITAGSLAGPQPSYNFNTSNNQITGTGYVYDAAGNMTNDSAHTYRYDADGNILSVDSGSTTTYVYNGLNQRVETVIDGYTTDFVFNAAGQRVSIWNGATNTQYTGNYYWGSKPMAFYNGGQTTFQHQDWLGTERFRTTYNGGVAATFTSLPFGDAETETSGHNYDAYHFAGLDSDGETGTDHAQFRQYSSTQGRWMRPDPYSGSYDPSNPQSFNRYSYLLNNPLASVDPLGLDGCGGDNGPKANVVAHDGSGVHAEEDDGGVDPCDVGISSGGPGGSGDPTGGNGPGSAFPPGSIVQDQYGNTYVIGAGGILIPLIIGYGSGSGGCNMTDLSCQSQYTSLTQQFQPIPGLQSKMQTFLTNALATAIVVANPPKCDQLAKAATNVGRVSGVTAIYSLAAAVTGVGLPEAAAVGIVSTVTGVGSLIDDMEATFHIGCFR
jgi:RHS repeat-associated protein